MRFRWVILSWAIMVILVSSCVPATSENGKSASRSHATASVDSFYFVQMTDTHWGARDGMAISRRAVEMINKLPVKIEFVVVTGDLFSDAISRTDVVEEALGVMKSVKVPVYYVPGNHDILKNDFEHTRQLFEKHFGPINSRQEVKGVVCLFLCTEWPANESRSPGHAERDWVEKSLARDVGNKPVLLFMHRPPLRDLLGGSEGESSWDDPYDTRWEELFGRHPEIKAVFAGHFHRDELCWIGPVPVHVAGAVARFWDRQPLFRLYQYKGGRINSWTLYPERTEPRMKR